MITRPLDVSTRLRPPPRNYDYLFWVNGVLIALFFIFFGSRFVLSPGLGVAANEELLPLVNNAVRGAVPTQLTLRITPGGQLYVDTGFVTFPQLQEWLAAEAKRNPGATLLVLGPPKNSQELHYQVVNAANAVGLRVQVAALDSADVSSSETSDR